MSLGLLGIEEVDLHLVHWSAAMYNRYVDTWRALIELHRQGRARSIGVSNFKARHLRRIIDETGIVPVVNQIELHPWLPQSELRALDAELGILTEAWSPLASGELLDDPLIGAIGSKHERSPAQVIIRWHLQSGSIVLPKTVTPARISENIDVFSFELDDEDLAAIATLESGHRTGPDPDYFNVLLP
ncbi:MAG: putative oxidoreductase [Nitrospira sp.]|nr:putative oxidoreductase [Nitrospira sp.]